MTLSKIIIECFLENLTLEELREFINKVLIPQKATGLVEHAQAAEKIINQGGDYFVKDKHKKTESVAK